MTKITTKSGKEYFLIELSQEDFNAPKLDEIDYKNIFYTRYNAGVKIEFPPLITEQEKNEVKIEIGNIIFADNSITRLVPTQDEFKKVRDNYQKIGEYFAKNGFITSWAQYIRVSFQNSVPNAQSQMTSRICVIILCRLMEKNYDFFINNATFLQSIYKKKCRKGWLGFASFFVNDMKNLTEVGIKEYIDVKYEEIFG